MSPREVASWLFLLGLLLSGCATSPVLTTEQSSTQADRIPESEQAEASAATDASTDGTEAVTLALLKQSERAAENGSLAEALSYAERAVRIEPRRADLWTHLASLELADGDPQAAVQHANKALALSRNRPDWQRAAWLVIADAKDATGDSEGARSIRERWQTGHG